MVTPHSQRRVSYERALRVIGRHLDAEPAYHPSVLEVPNGFTVRSQPVQHRTNGQVVFFDWFRLESLAILHQAARQTGRKRKRHQGIWGTFPNGHEDFFRALGHWLDDEDAINVSIDELPHALSVSYTRAATTDGDLYEKCHVVFQREEVERMLQEAQSRRGTVRTAATA